MIHLGNIKQTHIKNTAIDLVERFPDKFSSESFDHNKEKVSELIKIDSKIMRNKIAGYITRYMVSQQHGQPGRPISE